MMPEVGAVMPEVGRDARPRATSDSSDARGGARLSGRDAPVMGPQWVPCAGHCAHYNSSSSSSSNCNCNCN